MRRRTRHAELLVILFVVFLSANAGATVLLSEDFSGGALQGFDIVSGTWYVDNGQLHVTTPSQYIADMLISNFGNLADGTVSVETTHLSGYTSTSIIGRYQDANHFYLGVTDSYAQSIGATPARSLAIYKISSSPFQAGSLGNWFFQGPQTPWPYAHLLAGSFFPIEIGSAISLSMQFDGDQISLSVNGNQVLTAVDNDNPYLEGQVGLQSCLTDATFDNFQVESSASSVPEPSTLFLLGTGLAGLAFTRRRFSRSSSRRV